MSQAWPSVRSRPSRGASASHGAGPLKRFTGGGRGWSRVSSSATARTAAAASSTRPLSYRRVGVDEVQLHDPLAHGQSGGLRVSHQSAPIRVAADGGIDAREGPGDRLVPEPGQGLRDPAGIHLREVEPGQEAIAPLAHRPNPSTSAMRTRCPSSADSVRGADGTQRLARISRSHGEGLIVRQAVEGVGQAEPHRPGPPLGIVLDLLGQEAAVLPHRQGVHVLEAHVDGACLAPDLARLAPALSRGTVGEQQCHRQVRVLHGQDGRVVGLVGSLDDMAREPAGDGGRWPEPVLREVHHVGAAVREHTATGAVPGALPAVGVGHPGELVADDREGGHELPADGVLIEELTDPPVDRQEALVERDVEAPAGSLGGSDHVVGLRQRVADGLVGDDVLAGREGLQGDLVVQVVRQADVDDVDGGIVEQGAVVGLGTPQRDIACRLVERRGVGLGQRHGVHRLRGPAGPRCGRDPRARPR